MELKEMVERVIGPKPLYVVYDASGASEPPVLGVFDSEEAARDAITEIVMEFVEMCLAEPAEETGLTENDRLWLIKDTYKSFGIQVLENGLNSIHTQSSCA